MTVIFEKFKRQYYSTGREKADGYVRGHFDGLSANEKIKAFDMLSDEMGVNPDAVEWLFYLNDRKAKQVCLDYIQANKSGDKSGFFVIYYYLYKQSGDIRYQKKMIDEFYDFPDYQRGVALEYLRKTKVSMDYTDFLRSIIAGRHVEDLANRAAYHYLLAHNVPGETKKEQEVFDNFLDSLKSTDLSIRSTIMDEIKQSYPI